MLGLEVDVWQFHVPQRLRILTFMLQTYQHVPLKLQNEMRKSVVLKTKLILNNANVLTTLTIFSMQQINLAR